ncbi:MAG: PD-(D/E)XK nuclease family protein, partial [Treponema sp.]|nr:PD-(D/E)XK nuclease family protein [Treponema sp.]
MRITNKMNLPEALVKAVTVRKHNDPGRLSATTLLNGTKQIILTDHHWDDLEEDVADLYYAISGSAVHSVLEKDEGADEFTEEFISYELDGITVTGRIDNYNMRTGVIADWKNVKVFKIKIQNFEDWRKQGLIYAWLLRKNGFEVKTCRFIAFIKDHSKWEAKRDSSYPKAPVYVKDFAVTEEGLEEIEAFMKGKIAEYKQHREMADDDIPPCTPEERWDRPTKYAVMKGNNK